MAILSGFKQVPPKGRPAPAPSKSGFAVIAASKGITPAPGYGNIIPTVKRPPAPPAGLLGPPSTSNLGDVSAFGSWGGDGGNEWTPAGYDQGGGDNQSGGGYWDPSSDPGYLAAQNAENLGLSQLDANLTEARRQAIIRFGDASLADVAGFGLDPQAADFAKQNYLSGNADLARLNKAHDLRRQAIINQLASHGILGSGDLGYLEGQEDQGAGTALYDAKNKVLDYLRGLNDTYLDRKNQLRAATVAALQNAYQFGMANPGLYAGGAGGGSGGGGGGQMVMGSNGQPYAVGGNQTGNGSGNFQNVSSANQLDTSGGWGVRWTGPGRYEARKFAPTTQGGQSDTVWVKVG